MPRLPHFIGAIVLTAFASAVPSHALAAGPDLPGTVYGELHLGLGGVRHSELDFYPGFASASAGVFVYPDIGLEAFVDGSLGTDDKAGFDSEVSQAAGVALRLQSPAVRGLRAYMLLGYVNFTIEQQEDDQRAQRTVVQSFGGARVSVGLSQALQRHDNIRVNVEYRNYYVDEPITVDGFSLGLRWLLR